MAKKQQTHMARSVTAEKQNKPHSRAKRQLPSLSTVILLMMLLGAITGLFFGEMVSWMKQLGNAVIQLMQMTILPYIVVSLFGGLGKLSTDDARSVFSKAGAALGLLWLTSLVFILLTPISFPEQESGSFFSKALLSRASSADFFQLYIPANPFKSMASGAIPAVVLFSIAVGVALISVKQKQSLLESLDSMSAALMKVNRYITYTLPVGVFASTAGAAGSLTLEQFGTLQVFLTSYMVLCLLLTFLILPRLVAALVPISSRELISLSRGALVTAFATSNIFIVLPELQKVTREIFRNHKLSRPDTDSMVDVMLPLAFSFPNAGKLTVLLFVPFAGWFSGKLIPLAEYPEIAVTGLLSLFGSIFGAIPLLLEDQHLPSDLFQLFIVSNFISSKFISLVAAMHMLAFAVLAVAAYQKQLSFSVLRLMKNLVLITALSTGSLLGCRAALAVFVPDQPALSEKLLQMQISDQIPEVTFASERAVKTAADDSDEQALTAPGFAGIRQRGELRVGYLLGAVPFSYFNLQQQLVGFDVALMEMLASELEVSVSYIPYQREKLQQGLENNNFDIAIGGLELSMERLIALGMTLPVLDMPISVLTHDYRVKEFASLDKIRQHDDFRLAMVGKRREIKRFASAFPNIIPVPVDSFLSYLRQPEVADALLISAEEGYAWSILFPQFGVVIPKGATGRTATGYAVSKQHQLLLGELNGWLALRQLDGDIQRTYDFWILGEGTKISQPRWSVIRNVLQWVD